MTSIEAHKRYIAILRRSKGGAEGMSMEQQTKRCDDVAQQKGGKVAKTIEAPDQSGYTAIDSEAWKQAVAAVEAREYDGIVFAYVDRFTRNMWAAGAFLQRLKDRDAELWFADHEHVDYRTDSGRQQINTIISQGDAGWHNYRTKGVENIDTMLANGVPNRVPYGYRRNALHRGADKIDPELAAKALVPDEATAPVVGRIFAMRAAGAKWSEITAWLESDGIPSPSGRPLWTTSSLATIVRNAAYLGHVVFGREIKVRNAHKPLVDPATFRAAQSTRSVVRTGRNAVGVAGPFLSCPSCGRSLSVISNGTGGQSYACRRMTGEGRCAKPVHVHKARTDAWVDARLEAFAEGRVKLDVVQASRQLDDAQAARAAAAEELESFVLNASAAELGALYAKGLEMRQAALREAERAIEEAEAKAGAAKDFPRSAVEWRSLPLARKHAMARSIGLRVTVAPFEGHSSKTSDVESRLAVVVGV